MRAHSRITHISLVQDIRQICRIIWNAAEYVCWNNKNDKEEFDQCESIKPIAKNIRASAIIAYVIGAISLVANVILGGNVFGILDVAIVVGLGLGIQFAKSRVCAVILGVYSVFNLIY